jgi:hypothetical protein
MSDYISDQLRAKAAALRGSIGPTSFGPGSFLRSTPGGRLTFTDLLMRAWLDDNQPSPKTRAEEQAARKAAAERAQAAALAEWEQLRERIPETPEGRTLRALLAEHRPRLDDGAAYYRKPACDHCDQIGGWERNGVDWPCVNYEIIREGMG